MRPINRSLLIVKPAQPFLDWLHAVDPSSKELHLDAIQEDSTAFLVPEILNNDDKPEVLKKVYAQIFEYELEGWYEDASVWPAERDLGLFKKWFDYEFQSLVLDVVGGGVGYED
jgi:hypothetical protein